ncbi:MAG TPA: phosphoenolpyruvate--protein phosphotransferase [Dermatophilaceae bacterium]|nr:phosphoenolpyruvate--protein phosphotransferase [Dermatophilaceae bacterium]
MSAIDTRHGIGVSPGIAVGPVVQVRPPVRPPEKEPAAADPAAAGQLIRKVLESVAGTLDDRAARADPTAQQILTATAMMARDPGLASAADKHLAGGSGPATAVDAAAEEYCTMFSAAGGYLAERVTDLRDVRDRAVARLLGIEDPGVPELTEPSVIVAHDLAPAETASLQRDLVLAIVTESGGPTSHTAILAAQMGIPAVVQLPRAVTIAVGTVLAVDGTTGEVFIEPDAATQADLVKRSERRAGALGAVSGPGATSDGHPVALLANIGTAEDAERAGVLDVEGVGLFRTEFLFLERETAPTLKEQVAVYTRVFEAFGTRRVVVRTLDAGADKPLAFADLGPEENPALGRRGLRLSAERPELLDTQLTALGEAAGATGADVRVMAPMVATAEEAAWFARRVREHGLPVVGVMIEVPAAALRSRHVLAEVDFASIGTNDLAQYALAADRMQGELATLLDPWQPAVLDLVAAACDGGRDTGKHIGVCGEAAADPLLALVLTGLGVSSLSMAPTRVPAVRASLHMHDLRTCTAMAAAARAARSPQDARDAVLALADTLIADLI